MTDPYNLQRFVDAQKGDFAQACVELHEGRKVGHWIWYIFPQIEGLGTSDLSRFYAITSRSEAEAYLMHPVLGPNLEKCTRLVNQVEGRSAREIFRGDDVKFRSSMTLFANATSDNKIFKDALDKYFGGEPDNLTVQRLSKGS